MNYGNTIIHIYKDDVMFFLLASFWPLHKWGMSLHKLTQYDNNGWLMTSLRQMSWRNRRQIPQQKIYELTARLAICFFHTAERFFGLLTLVFTIHITKLICIFFKSLHLFHIQKHLLFSEVSPQLISTLSLVIIVKLGLKNELKTNSIPKMPLSVAICILIVTNIWKTVTKDIKITWMGI